jgi:FKBP-type peptidyl-prolyl cis-trans isomerase FklB
MKYSILTLSLFGLIHGTCLAEDAISEKDKVNYSLGYELGKDLKREELELSPEILLQGVKDAIEGNRPKVNSRERRQSLADIKQKRAQENLEKSQAFLAEKAEMEGVVSTPSGLLYKVVQAGEGKTPTATDQVTVNYRGTLIDGSQFDSSYDRGKPSKFKVNRVIKGWSEALQLMKEGAKWELFIPPELAYGKRGRKPIPPNSALVFEVELISVDSAQKGASPK